MITKVLVVAHESSGLWVVVYLESAKFARVVIPPPRPRMAFEDIVCTLLFMLTSSAHFMFVHA